MKTPGRFAAREDSSAKEAESLGAEVAGATEAEMSIPSTSAPLSSHSLIDSRRLPMKFRTLRRLA